MPLSRNQRSDNIVGPKITRGTLARLTDCNIENIRYYEKVGLMQPPKRTASGYRVYGEADVSRLNFILKAKSLGFNQEAIHDLVDMSIEENQRSRSEVKQLAIRHRSEIKQKIADLKRIDKGLGEIISHCDGADAPARDCPILESLFDVRKYPAVSS